MMLEPTRISSPSSRRRRPATRSPFTNEPLLESPSSMSAQCSPTRSSSACTRETCSSQSRQMPLPAARPIVTAPVASVKRQDPLLALAITVEGERPGGPLGRDPLLQIGGG